MVNGHRIGVSKLENRRKSAEFGGKLVKVGGKIFGHKILHAAKGKRAEREGEISEECQTAVRRRAPDPMVRWATELVAVGPRPGQS